MGAARFSFGRPELLKEVLGVEPGLGDAAGPGQRCRAPRAAGARRGADGSSPAQLPSVAQHRQHGDRDRPTCSASSGVVGTSRSSPGSTSWLDRQPAEAAAALAAPASSALVRRAWAWRSSFAARRVSISALITGTESAAQNLLGLRALDLEPFRIGQQVDQGSILHGGDLLHQAGGHLRSPSASWAIADETITHDIGCLAPRPPSSSVPSRPSADQNRLHSLLRRALTPHCGNWSAHTAPSP